MGNACAVSTAHLTSGLEINQRTNPQKRGLNFLKLQARAPEALQDEVLSEDESDNLDECTDEWLQVADEQAPSELCIINWYRGIEVIYYSETNFVFMLEQYEEAALDARIWPLCKAFIEENYLQLVSESYSVLKTCVVIAADEIELHSKSLLEFLKTRMEAQNNDNNYLTKTLVLKLSQEEKYLMSIRYLRLLNAIARIKRYLSGIFNKKCELRPIQEITNISQQHILKNYKDHIYWKICRRKAQAVQVIFKAMKTNLRFRPLDITQEIVTDFLPGFRGPAKELNI